MILELKADLIKLFLLNTSDMLILTSTSWFISCHLKQRYSASLTAWFACVPDKFITILPKIQKDTLLSTLKLLFDENVMQDNGLK